MTDRRCMICGANTLVPTRLRWPDDVRRYACWGECLDEARVRLHEWQGRNLNDRGLGDDRPSR